MSDNLSLICEESPFPDFDKLVENATTFQELFHKSNIASDDALTRDPQQLKRLLQLERHYTCTPNYFHAVQKDLVTPLDRYYCLEYANKVLTRLQVDARTLQTITSANPNLCVQVVTSGRHNELFQTVANFLDRYLSRCPTQRKELQGLTLGCLTMALKVLHGEERLGDVARFGEVPLESLISYESQVGHGLKWEGISVTPVEFIQELIAQLNLPVDTAANVNIFSTDICNFLILDSNRIGILPSTLACVCVLYAVEVKLSSFYEFALKLFLDSTESEYDSFMEEYRACITSIKRPYLYHLPPSSGGTSEKGNHGNLLDMTCETPPTELSTPTQLRDVWDTIGQSN